MGLLSLPLVFAAAAAFVIFKVLSYYFCSSCSPNPFESMHSPEVKAKVIDQKQRDLVLKQGLFFLIIFVLIFDASISVLKSLFVPTGYLPSE